jgi:hypothetical protein
MTPSLVEETHSRIKEQGARRGIEKTTRLEF